MHRVSSEQVKTAQDEYKKKYKPFRAFSFTNELAVGVSKRFANLVMTQNGVDTDDYSVDDSNKIERYLKEYAPNKRVLILGAGTGREVLVAKDMGLDAVGTTLGSRNTDFAYEYLGLSENELLECLNEVLPFPSKSFDVVAGFQIFEHTLSPLLFLLEQRRVLRDGGVLLLEWPPADKFSMEDNPHHQVCFSPGQAFALFQKAGFSNIELLYDDMTVIPEEDLWRCDQDKMLVIKGVKGNCPKDYILRSESL